MEKLETSKDLLNLSNTNYWMTDVFRNRLIKVFPPEVDAKLVFDFLDANNISSFQDLKNNIGKIQDKNPEIYPHFKKIVESAEESSSCYLRDTSEKTRFIQWPNNIRLKQTNPDHFFDLYEQDFIRKKYQFITKDTKIGSAGSCFALRISHQLQLWGYNYVIEEDDLPDGMSLEEMVHTNYRMGPARSGTLFNTPSLRQMVERAFGEFSPDKILYKNKKGNYLDPFRSIKPLYVDEAGYLEDYDLHTKALNKALSECDVFIFTLGLIETWTLAHNGQTISVAPAGFEPMLLKKKTLTVQDNVSELEKMYAVFKKHNPKIKFIISVSPVPLNKTYSKDDHVVVANCLSKSTLRVAVEEFIKNHPEDTFYFPSYETVMYGSENPWEEDKRHVSNEAVSKVMKSFQKQFLVSQDELSIRNFEEGKGIELGKLQSLKFILKSRIKSIINGFKGKH